MNPENTFRVNIEKDLMKVTEQFISLPADKLAPLVCTAYTLWETPNELLVDLTTVGVMLRTIQNRYDKVHILTFYSAASHTTRLQVSEDKTVSFKDESRRLTARRVNVLLDVMVALKFFSDFDPLTLTFRLDGDRFSHTASAYKAEGNDLTPERYTAENPDRVVEPEMHKALTVLMERALRLAA